MNAHSLDLFSTSPTKQRFSVLGDSAYCSYGSPFFAYQKEGSIYGLVQGCCNHWDCAKCGVLRAKQEYGRIVNGVELLSASNPLYFITITCKGRELSEYQAFAGYMRWTNRLLDACRIRYKRQGKKMTYVQVTEKQKRGHPHSHILTTFTPNDLALGWKDHWIRRNGRLVNEYQACYRSEWLQEEVVNAGLGEQYDISIVQTAAAASRYVAKYMFKKSMFQANFPKGWKRVRYSQDFPKLPIRETNAFVLLSNQDWRKLASLASIVITDSEYTKQEALFFLRGNDVLVG